MFPQDTLVKINFIRQGATRSWKVYTSKRVKNDSTGKSQPVQIHLAYISQEPPFSPDFKKRVETNLEKKWKERFGHQNVTIDWKNAESKFIAKLSEM